MSYEYIFLFLFVVLVVFLVALAAIGIWAFFFGKKLIYRLLKPNPHDIHRDLERIQRLYPNESADELAARIIRQNALFLGFVGIFSGLGGFITTIVGTPLDISVSTLRQMKMVHIITALYGNDDLDSDALEIKYMSLVLGSAGASKLLFFIILKMLGNTIPFAGSIFGFSLNWFFTKSIGESAIAWNNGESLRERGRNKFQELKEKTVSTTDAAWQKVKPTREKILHNAPSIEDKINSVTPPNVNQSNISE